MTAQPLTMPITPPAPRLPAVNGDPGLFFQDGAEYMILARRVCQWAMRNNDLTRHELAKALRLHDNDLKRLFERPPDWYSARVVSNVLGLNTAETRLIYHIAPDSPPSPRLLLLATPLVRKGGTWAIRQDGGYTLQDVADMAGCTRRTVQRYVAMGAIPIVELVPGQPPSHRVARVPAREAEAWVEWYRAKEVERRAG